jgi:transposase
MWTKENPAGYDRRGLRYPSDLTDEEWAVLVLLISRAKRGGNKRSVDERSLVVRSPLSVPDSGMNRPTKYKARGARGLC